MAEAACRAGSCWCPSRRGWRSTRRCARLTGLRAKTDPQAVGALRGSWAFCHVRAPGGGVVAMGRVIGDGGWYFTLADVATLPDYQRRGLGGQVLGWLLKQIAARAPAGPVRHPGRRPAGPPVL